MEAVGLVPLYCQDDIVLYKFVQLVATSTVLVTSCFFQVRFGDGNGSWDKPIVSALESVPTMADRKMQMLVPTPMETTHRRSQRHGGTLEHVTTRLWISFVFLRTELSMEFIHLEFHK